VRRAGAKAFAKRVGRGSLRIDVGAGAGRYTNDLGRPVVALDASLHMLGMLRSAAPAALVVAGDLEALPFRRHGLHGAWSNMAYQHVPSVRVPLALHDLHRSLAPGTPLDLQVQGGDYEGRALPGDTLGGRYFAGWSAARLHDVLVGAGFVVDHVEVDGDVTRARATTTVTLADTVGPGMRLLVCGLNPSVYSAERGVGFARPGNRFWPAALAAGLVSKARDSRAALVDHRIGMTDLCKRATVASAELTRDEYRDGAARVERLVAWLRPDAVCFVGLEGWRAAIDRRATPGEQPRPFGGRPAYLMPSTSGLNAHSRPADLADHLRRATALADANH
jgi:TDG/mug DNA glycosylase family protein